MTLSRAGAVLRHPISQNAIALYWVQFATFVVPLVTLPYTSRVLGASAFGLVIFAQGFSWVVGLFIDYGFNASATRDIAAARDSDSALSELVARVFGAKVILAAGSLLLAALALVLIPKLRENPELLVLAWVAAVATGFSPGWFFIGIERLRLPALIQLSTRVFAAALTFVLVKDPEDAWIVLALYAAGCVAGALIVNTLLYRRLPARLPRLRGSVQTLKEGWPLFVGTGAIALYTSANVVLLGLFVSSAQVAFFGAAERVVRAVGQLIGPVAAAVLPRISYLQASGEPARARRLAWISVFTLGGIGLAAGSGLAVLAPIVVSIVFGDDFESTVPLLRALAFLIPLIAVATALAGWMLSKRMDKQVQRVVVTAGLVNVVLVVILVPLFGSPGMVVSVLLSEAIVLAGCVLAIRRRDSASSDEGSFFGPLPQVRGRAPKAPPRGREAGG